MKRIEQAIVLAAGLGKRLRPLTLTTPKPLLPMQGKPIIETILERLKHHGIHKIVVNTHYLAAQLESYLAQISNVEILISHEPILLDTGGAVRKILNEFGEQPFFAVNADIWWQESTPTLLQRLETEWNETTMDALLAMVPKPQAIGFSGVGDYYFKTHSILNHRHTTAEAPYIFSGVRILHPNLFLVMDPGTFPQLPLFHQAEAKQRLHGLIHYGKWCDIGTLESYQALHNYLSA